MISSSTRLSLPRRTNPGAQGNQLDMVGESLGIPRQEGWSDETYRAVMVRMLKRFTWDGTNETVPQYLEAGETLVDAGGNAVRVHTAGSLPIAVEEQLPVPVGVRIICN